MRTHLKHHWPLAAALIVFTAISAVILAVSFSGTDRQLVYSLDDPYIHMAMAKNFAQHGVWGVTRYEFSSSTSSLLWTLLLSGIYYVTGPHASTPYILNLAFQASLITLLYFILRRYTLSPLFLFFLLLMIPMFATVPAVVVTGQEHVLQAIIALVFVYVAARELSRDGPGTILPAALAPLVTGIRYEGLFLILPVCVLFILRGRWRKALMIGSFAVLPLIVYAGICRMYDWPLLPASLVIKGSLPDPDSAIEVKKYLHKVYNRMPHNIVLMRMLYMLFGAYILGFRRALCWSTGKCMCVTAFTGCLLHALFSSHGYVGRYETSILVTGLVAYCIALLESIHSKHTKKPVHTAGFAVVAFLGLLIAIPLTGRAYQSLAVTPRSCISIYRQQCQMAAFLKRFYKGCSVAINDIGAINYFSDIRCLDLVGLGNREVCRLAHQKALSPEVVSSLAKANNTKIAIIYDFWFRCQTPAEWKKVGEWKIPYAASVAGDTVSFYAVDPAEKARLIECLRRFSPALPDAVREDGEYTWDVATLIGLPGS